MKFYQTIAPMILSMMYATAIFGAEGLSLYDKTPWEISKTPKDVCKIIDDFREYDTTNNLQKNDSFYEKTGHIKIYSSLLNLITNYSTKRRPLKENRPTIIKDIVPLMLFTLSLASLKIFNTSRLAYLFIGLLSFRFIYFLAKKADYLVASRLVDSHLIIDRPEKIVIEDRAGEICITNRQSSDNEPPKIERRSLSNMKLMSTQSTPSFTQNQDLFEKDELTYKLEKNAVNIKDRETQETLYSLPIPKSITAFYVSDNEKIIVTAGKDGIYKCELQESKSLYEIMNPDTD